MAKDLEGWLVNLSPPPLGIFKLIGKALLYTYILRMAYRAQLKHVLTQMTIGWHGGWHLCCFSWKISKNSCSNLFRWPNITQFSCLPHMTYKRCTMLCWRWRDALCIQTALHPVLHYQKQCACCILLDLRENWANVEKVYFMNFYSQVL